MSQKNETTVLVLAFLITAALLGGGFWWFTRKPGFDGGRNGQNQSERSQLAQKIETFAQVQNVPTGLFNYGGSTVWVTVRKEVDPAIQTVWPQFQLRYTAPNGSAPSSEAGIQMLLNNQLDFAQSSAPLTDENYQKAQQRGFKLTEIPVALDAIAVVVNPSLNILGLTVDQFNDIYAGKITNWNQVGGPNLKIKPYGNPDRDSSPAVELVPTTTDALRKVEAEPGGIYYSSAPLLISQCKVKPLLVGRSLKELVPPYKEPFVPLSQCPQKRNEVNTEAILSGQYPLTRRLLVIVKQNGQIEEKAGESYAKLLLTTQGKDLLTKAGFIPIR